MSASINVLLPVSAGGFRLLTPGNPKTEKGRGAGFWTFILHLAPARLSGYEVCAMRTAGCSMACLNTAGRGGMLKGVSRLTAEDVANGLHNTIQAARIRKTKAFFEHRADFMAVLVKDIRKAIAKARKEGFTPCFRLNGTSDIRWETIAITGQMVDGEGLEIRYPNIFAMFPDVQFYDYTKLPNRKRLPGNYALTFSLADGNDEQAAQALRNGLNVAAVFRDKATVARVEAEGFMGFPVFNGDDSDLRFLDPQNVVVALYAKGNAKRDASGFVRD